MGHLRTAAISQAEVAREQRVPTLWGKVLDHQAPQWEGTSEQLATYPVPPAVQTVLSTFQGTDAGAPKRPLTEGGPLMGGPQCLLSILRNGNVPCHYFRNFPVDFKIVQCRLSILRNGNVPCHYFKNFPVDFKIV